MKKLEFEGDTWYYKIKYDASEFGEYSWTEFFKTPTMKVKKYLLFGSLVEKENNKPDFKISRDIEDPFYSKEQIRDLVAPYMRLEKRNSEIKQGEII